MELLFVIALVAIVVLVLRGSAPPEPRVIQVVIDTEPPARMSAGAILICVLAVLVLLAIAGT